VLAALPCPAGVDSGGNNCVELNPVHQLLGVGGEDAKLRCFDPRTRKVVAALDVGAQLREVYGVVDDDAGAYACARALLQCSAFLRHAFSQGACEPVCERCVRAARASLVVVLLLVWAAAFAFAPPHPRPHARADARTCARTHARTHTRDDAHASAHARECKPEKKHNTTRQQ
jgi:hypothetical protein